MDIAGRSVDPRGARTDQRGRFALPGEVVFTPPEETSIASLRSLRLLPICRPGLSGPHFCAFIFVRSIAEFDPAVLAMDDPSQ